MSAQQLSVTSYDKLILALQFAVSLFILLSGEWRLIRNAAPHFLQAPLSASFLPSVFPIPMLFAFLMWLAILHMTNRGEMSQNTRFSINKFVGSLLMMCYVTMLILVLHINI